MQVRCKMTCTEKVNSVSPYRSVVDGKPQANRPICTATLVAATGEENKTWAKYTPSGTTKLQIDNPDAYDAFELGADYYVEFTKVV